MLQNRTIMSSGKTKGYKKVPMDESDDVKHLRERIKTQLNVSPKDVEVEHGREGKAEERAIAKSTKNNEGKLTRSLEKALKQLLPPVSPTVPVKTTQCNAKKLFGDAPYHSKKIHLRTSEQMKHGSAIKLPQFDPNFFSLDQVHCRYPDCCETKARIPNHSSKTNKEDLYLCQSHREQMVHIITKQCAERGIKLNVNYNDVQHEDFDGYISLIGLMEKAFQHFKKMASVSPTFPFPSSVVDLFLAEIFLNVRNLLIITNVLLNPDHVNIYTVLISVSSILYLLVERSGDRQFVENIVFLLGGVMETIYFYFGIVCTWVSLPFRRNQGAQIGAGLGCAAGAIAAAAAFGPALPVIALAAGIGLVSGGLFGGGIFNLTRDNHDRRHNMYQFVGNPNGSLIMQLYNN